MEENAEAHAESDKGRSVTLRRWRWDELMPYNGFNHGERARGWQLIHLLVDCGQLPPLERCSITGATDNLSWHSENYYDWSPYPLTKSVHFALHRRFKRPAEWSAIVDRYAFSGGTWFANLSPTPVDLAGDLRRLRGDGVADIFARAPIPPGLVIQPEQIYV